MQDSNFSLMWCILYHLPPSKNSRHKSLTVLLLFTVLSASSLNPSISTSHVPSPPSPLSTLGRSPHALLPILLNFPPFILLSHLAVTQPSEQHHATINQHGWMARDWFYIWPEYIFEMTHIYDHGEWDLPSRVCFSALKCYCCGGRIV